MDDDELEPITEKPSPNAANLAQAWDDSWMGQTVTESMSRVLRQQKQKVSRPKAIPSADTFSRPANEYYRQKRPEVENIAMNPTINPKKYAETNLANLELVKEYIPRVVRYPATELRNG